MVGKHLVRFQTFLVNRVSTSQDMSLQNNYILPQVSKVYTKRKYFYVNDLLHFYIFLFFNLCKILHEFKKKKKKMLMNVLPVAQHFKTIIIIRKTDLFF